MDRLEKPENLPEKMRLTLTPKIISGNDVLHAEDLSKSFPDKELFKNVSFDVRRGEKIAIIGPNGVGKSTLFKMLLGEENYDTGEIKLGTNVNVGYYDQEQQQLHPDKTVLDEVWDDHPEVAEKDIRSLLGSFLFVGDDVYKVVHELSGGEKARLELTKLSFEPINFLILDEPTNHLDIDSREVLESAINEFTGTVLFVSHDRYFINQVATDILDMRADGIKHYEGNYDDYLTATASAGPAPSTGSTSAPKEPASKGKQSYQQSKDQQRARRKLQREVDRLEKQMGDLESSQAAIQEQMSQPEVATDIGKLTDLQKQLDDLKNQSDEVELAWTAAAEKLEEFDQTN